MKPRKAICSTHDYSLSSQISHHVGYLLTKCLRLGLIELGLVSVNNLALELGPPDSELLVILIHSVLFSLLHFVDTSPIPLFKHHPLSHDVRSCE
jgi:hypothetical protein